MRKIFSFVVFCLFAMSSSLANGSLITSSEDTIPKRLVQLTGIVLGSDSLNNLPYTTVYDKSSLRGTITDYHGYFALVAQPGDTLIFRQLGYKPATYIVPMDIPMFGNALIQLMDIDTLFTKPVNVYPWPSREEFASAFVNLQLDYEDEIRRAQRQLSGTSLNQIAMRVQSDAGLAYSALEQQRLSQLYTRGQMPVNNLFNPVAWMQFVDAWKSGKLKRE